MRKFAIVYCAFFLVVIVSAKAFAETRLSRGQSVYVPVYSHVLIGDRGYTFDLAITLLIRNTDPENPLTVTSADYFDTEGKLVKKYIEQSVHLPPMASTYVFIKEKDSKGGIGANFIVRWKAEREINTPIIESVMIGTRSGQGISFVSPGQEIRE